MSVLERILESKRAAIQQAKEERPLYELESAAQSAPEPRDFREALAEGPWPRIIAEVKKASPSKGLIREDFDPVAIATAYERAGAAAISVLTDAEFFQGSIEDLVAVRGAVDVPLLRKDFIIDRYQLFEARAAGADAVLLILAALPDAALAELAAEAEALGMSVLWEVHDESEVVRVARLAPDVVGVNNRDLSTFEVKLETTRDLVPRLPPEVVSVSESGFSTRQQLEELREWGVKAYLIGESLMRAPQPGLALATLIEPELGMVDQDHDFIPGRGPGHGGDDLDDEDGLDG